MLTTSTSFASCALSCAIAIGTGHHERHAGYGGVVGWRNVQGLDVVAPARKHAGHARKGADFVLQKYGYRVSHRFVFPAKKNRLKLHARFRPSIVRAIQRVLQCNKN
jgi:hypothetical protein